MCSFVLRDKILSEVLAVFIIVLEVLLDVMSRSTADSRRFEGQLSRRCKPVSGLGQYNKFSHTLQVGLVPFKVAPFGVYTPDQAPLPLPKVQGVQLKSGPSTKP